MDIETTSAVPAGARAEAKGEGPGVLSKDDRATTESTDKSRNAGLSRRASLNTLAAVVDYVALVVVEFLVTPMLVAGLGKYLFGAWRVLWKFTGYLWATSGRSAPALGLAIANRQYSTDEEEKRRLVASAVVVWVAFLPIMLLIGGLTVWFAPDVLRTPAQYVGAIRAAAALLLADSIALTLLTIPRAVLQGENLGYKRMGLSGLTIVVGGGLIALAIHLDLGIVGVAAATCVKSLLTGALFWKVARRHVSWFGLARPTRDGVRWFLGLSWWFLVWKLVSEMMIAGDVIALGLFAPVELVTTYTLVKYIPDAVSGLLAKALQGVAPGIGGVIGSGDFARAIRARGDFMALTWLIVTVVGATVLVWTGSFLNLWVGREFRVDPIPVLAVVTMALQFVLIRNDAYFIDLTLSVRTKVLFGVFSTILSFVLAGILVGGLGGGIVGLCFGFIIGRAVLTIAYPWLVGRALGHPFASQLRGALRPAVVTVLLFALSVGLADHVTANSWTTLIAWSGATCSLVALGAVVLGLPADRRRALWERATLITKAARRSHA